MVDIPRNGLYGDDETADHLWEHRLELYHAQEVWDGPPFASDHRLGRGR